MIENFGKNISRLRREKGYSQEELAQKIGLKKQSISNIERGARYPTFETLEKFAQIFNATPVQLFGSPKEIAVSDTPIILDRIDEYDSKVQNILKAEKFLAEMASGYNKDLVEESKYILAVANAIYDIENYLKYPPSADDPYLTQIFNTANDIRTIQNHSDDTRN